MKTIFLVLVVVALVVAQDKSKNDKSKSKDSVSSQLAEAHRKVAEALLSLAKCDNKEECLKKTRKTLRGLRRTIKNLRRSKHHTRLGKLFRELSACKDSVCTRRVIRKLRRASKKLLRISRRSASTLRRALRDSFGRRVTAVRRRRLMKLSVHFTRIGRVFKRAARCQTKRCSRRMKTLLRRLQRRSRSLKRSMRMSAETVVRVEDRMKKAMRRLRTKLAKKALHASRLSRLYRRAARCKTLRCVSRNTKRIKRALERLRRRSRRSRRGSRRSRRSSRRSRRSSRRSRRGSRRSRRDGEDGLSRKNLRETVAIYKSRARMHETMAKLYRKGMKCRTARCFNSIRRRIRSKIASFKNLQRKGNNREERTRREAKEGSNKALVPSSLCLKRLVQIRKLLETCKDFDCKNFYMMQLHNFCKTK